MAEEYEVKTTKETRPEIIDKLHPLGVVTERWNDGSFNFQPYDTDCLDEMVDTLDELGIEYRLC